jgi:hypothetical protein
MKTLLFAGLVALPLSVGSAWAAERLSEAQMDRVVAGDVPTCAAGPGCNISSSSTTTNTTPQSPNGLLVTKTTNTFTCTAGTCATQTVVNGVPVSCIGGLCTNPGTNGVTGSTGGATTGNPVPFPPMPPVSIPPIPFP